MKLQFKHQQFQTDAANAVVDVFKGQPYLAEKYLAEINLFGVIANAKIILSAAQILKNLQSVQRRNNLKQSNELEKIGDTYNLTIEMETGVGKTYTYIKTMYELNKNYGWKKFIIIVPSIAIREGVYKTFQVTAEHFAEEYGTKIRYFIYNSARLNELENFVSDNEINALIINSQAFNARGENARRILTNLDEFNSEKPIEIVAATNPILIIDEPQSVEGSATRESLTEFKPMLILRYSATHRADRIFNMVYRLDAIDAYNKKLVKKIEVTGIRASSIEATKGFVYLEKINLSKNAPTATIKFDCKGVEGIRQITRTVGEGFNLYEKSGELEEYKNNFIVKFIDGRDDSLEFLNGVKIFAGDVIGKVDEEQIRRIQIRETIKAHLIKEEKFFDAGIKVLSLFFIDEVKHYKIYDEDGISMNGDFAKIFEEEYLSAVEEILQKNISAAYKKYLSAISVESTHAGYFSIDKKGRLTDSAIKNKKEKTSDDTDAYNLIMRNKELLLDLDAVKSPVRFIFSHSALREGWDNPNVFQICTLKQSGSDIRKRQEVGRGLRLCVNQFGERIENNHEINILTVVTSESYEDFTRKLQNEIADAVTDRPRKVTEDLFKEKFGADSLKIFRRLIKLDYIDDEDNLTEKFFADKADGTLAIDADVEEILDTIFDAKKLPVDDSRKALEVKVNRDKLAMPEFKNLWEKIHAKTFYEVEFDDCELTEKTVAALNGKLNVPKIFLVVKDGTLEKIPSKENLIAGTAFNQKNFHTVEKISDSATSSMKYEIIGRLVDETGLTRENVIEILRGINKEIFAQFVNNPEEFITKAGQIINGVKAVTIVEHISYHKTGETYTTNIFADMSVNGLMKSRTLKADKNLFDYVIYDSNVEKNFATDLEKSEEVEVYVKLPRGFYITTPLGNYNPDWALVFRENDVHHIYFVAETKGNVESLNLRQIENFKIKCAEKHFKIIAGADVTYKAVKNFEELLKLVKK